MPSTGSTSPGSRSNVQLRSSCSGPQMPIDSASSSPISRRTIIVRLAHGQPRATTSRYRPASAGSEPSRPSAVIRPSRYLVSLTNSPEAPIPRRYPTASAFNYPPRWQGRALADADPEGAFVARGVVGGSHGVGEQGGGAAAGVVRRPAGVAAGNEVQPYPVGAVRDGLPRRVADQRTELLAAGGVERERDLRRVAGAEAVVAGWFRIVEPVHPGGPRPGSGSCLGHPDRRYAEAPVGDHRGHQVARAGARPVAPVDLQAARRQPVRPGREGQRRLVDEVDGAGRDQEQ